jgi:drug/metabolite transporter (DMT)-like permease
VLHLVKRLDMPPIIMVAYFSFLALLSLTVFIIGEYAAGQLLVPVFAAFMAIGLLSEHMHGYHVVALLMVLAGIALAEKHKVLAPAG